MTALAGWTFSPSQSDPAHFCAAILAKQRQFSSSGPEILAANGAAFGVALAPLLPPHRERPAVVRNERLLLAADARIDNRSELIEAFSLPAEATSWSDAQILLAAWMRLGQACLQRLVGDFAIAVFDLREQQLLLARDPTGQRPLFYVHSPNGVAFASMPGGLLRSPAGNRGWNFRRLAESMLDQPLSEESYFAGIARVMPGELVRISRGSLARSSWWRPNLEPLQLGAEDYVEAYRHVLDEAVKSRLARQKGPIACHLSSGYDSSAVASTAARLDGQPILAYTSVPSSDFRSDVPRGRMADEGPLAARTAGMHGMNHRLIHSRPFSVDYLRRQSHSFQEPARNLINGLWCADILCSAKMSDAQLLLTGALGNLTLNAGGLAVLADWIAQGRFGEWWRQARLAAASGHARWRGVLFNSVAPWLPWPAWTGLRAMFQGVREREAERFLRRDWRRQISGSRADVPPSGRPAADRVRMIQSLDPGMIVKGSLALEHVHELDPMSDRRLMEFSLRLPSEQLLHDGVWRPLARRALADRVPAEVLNSPLRGMQAADWPLLFQPKSALEILEEIASSSTARDFLDLVEIQRAIARWPDSGRHHIASADLYSRKLPILLAAGVFIREFDGLC